jgi:hypothetical protein
MLGKQSGRTDVEVRIVEPKNAPQSEIELLKGLGVAIVKVPSTEIAHTRI